MSLTDEEYWRKSSLESFNFDDDIIEEPPTNTSSSSDNASETVFYATLQNSIVLPMHSIISKRGLDIILQDTRLPPETRSYSTEETIKKLFLGLPCLLDNFRSLEQKVDLLAKAVETADGNVILKVVLYLEKSLKRSLLHVYLSKYKLALTHYCNYLIQEHKYQDLNDLYMANGNDDMINLFYIPCQHFTSRARIHSELEKFLNESGNTISDYNKNLLQNFKTFSEWQKSDAINKSVTEQLAILYVNHFTNSSPQQEITTLCNIVKLSNSQQEWIMLNTMASHSMWDPLVEAFVKPSLFKKKIKSSINIDSLMNSLYKHNAPKKVLEQFLVCIGDNEKCLQLGKKMQCHGFIVNKLVENRDRLGLIEYRKYIPSQSEEYFNLEKNLCSDRKWKN